MNLAKRCRDHQRQLADGSHANRHMLRAWIKHSENAFIFDVLELSEPRHLIAREQFYLGVALADGAKGCFNIARTAGSQIGLKRTKESRERMAASHRGKKQSPEANAKRSLWFVLLTDTQREINSQRRSCAQKMRHAAMTPDKKAEISLKLSAALKGKSPSEETRTKIAAALLGRKLKPDHIASIAAGHGRRLASMREA